MTQNESYLPDNYLPEKPKEWRKVTETYLCFLLDQTVNWTVGSLQKQYEAEDTYL